MERKGGNSQVKWEERNIERSKGGAGLFPSTNFARPSVGGHEFGRDEGYFCPYLRAQHAVDEWAKQVVVEDAAQEANHQMCEEEVAASCSPCFNCATGGGVFVSSCTRFQKSWNDELCNFVIHIMPVEKVRSWLSADSCFAS